MTIRPKWLFCVACVLVISISLASAAYPFRDGAEDGLTAWSADPPWAVTTESPHGGTQAFTDSPSSYYANDADVSLTQSASMDLSAAVRPRLLFWQRHNLEYGFDFGQVEISLDGGASWQPEPLATYTGGAAWHAVQIDLSAYAGQATVKLRFRLVTDATVTQDGWTIDDIVVDEAPAPVTLDPPTGATANTLTLNWSASTDPEFAEYELLRGMQSGFDAADAHVVTTIDDPATTSHVDIGLSPKTRYFYRVIVRDADGMESLSNEVDGTTLAGMDFPLLDTGESGPATWNAENPWALSDEAAHDGTQAWSDSPGGDYASGLAGTSLTLAAPVDLSAATQPVLSFWHTYDFPGNDHGLVEVSTNGGLDWSALADYTGGSVAEWTHVQLDLSAYRTVSVLVRFRVTTDSSTTGDGWHIDDISLSEQPAALDAPVLTEQGPHSVRLTWNEGTDVSFSHYAIHRASPSGASINSLLVTTITDAGTTTHVDSGLTIGETYAYRIYVVNAYGAYGPDSASESSFTTAALPLPFSDDFESGLGHWEFTGEWSTTAADANGGTYSLQDSPGDYLPNSDTTITTQLDLGGTTWPVLTFWDRFAYEERADWGAVEVSRDGNSWSPIYSANGERVTWERQRVDLSPWRGEERLYLRLHLRSNSATHFDGWYVDDLEVSDHAPLAAALPLGEDFELDLEGWIDSSWALSTSDSHAGAQAALDVDGGALTPGAESALTLDRPLDLSATTDPQLVFWVKGTTAYRQYFRVQASTDGGLTWQSLFNGGVDTSTWERRQYSLAAYRSAATRLRFVTLMSSASYWGNEDLELDDVVIREAPAAPTLEAPQPHLKSMDLSWSAPAAADFARYAIYRSTSAGIDTADELVAEITDAGVTSYTDTGLSIGLEYHYRVYLVTTDEAYAPSNEVSARTAALSLPLVDPMESDENWVAEGTNGSWGLEATDPHGGASCFSDSPGAAYQSSADLTLKTAIDLSSATWPVLSFWGRSDFELDADSGHVEVSTNGGSNWTGVFATSGTADTWTHYRVDLSPFKGHDSVLVRFHTRSNGSVVADGWCIDDVEISEHVAPARTIPFEEGFESGAGDWLASNWELEEVDPRSGTRRMQDFPRGEIIYYGDFANTLSGEFDLSATSDPQLVFWVKGSTGYKQSLRAQVSTDHGVSWADTWAQGAAWNEWTRIQVSLANHRQSAVRLRFVTRSSNYWEGTGVALDDIALAEEPDAPTMEVPVPHLKSMDLAWSAPTVANFARYELYRDTDSTVDLDSTKIAEITDPALTSHTDTGLAIGTNYYYRVYLVTDDEIYTPSNTVSKATVALELPLSDPMESGDNWFIEGTNGEWTVSDVSPHAGTGAYTDSAGGAYQDSMNASLTTAVDLGEATWPVLTFWDRFDYADTGDIGRVEVSTDSGAHWTSIYAATGSSSAWTERHVDLSPWNGHESVMLRFRSTSNGSGVGDGWSVDTLSVAESTTSVRTLPFFDGFESGDGSWHSGAWEVTGDEAHGGSVALEAFPHEVIPASGEFAAHIDGPFDLSGTTAPRLTFWVKGSLGYRQYVRAQASTDGGVTWSSLWSQSTSWDEWTRFQVELDGYRTASTRIRFVISSSSYTGGTAVTVDDIAIEEALPAPALEAPVDITPTSMRLRWDQSTAPNFAYYVVYRSRSAGVDEADTLLATITDREVHEYTDLGLETRARYYYRVYAYSTGDVGSGSGEVIGVTQGVGMPFSDDFETDDGLWTFEGDWGREAGLGREGSYALTDAPGVYPNSSNTSAKLGVDLSSTVWPVLSFHEHHDLETNVDWANLEISSDFGASWTRVLAVSAEQSGWTERHVDLSPWRDEANVWIRFNLLTNSSTAEDGWFIDDLRLHENTPPALTLPFHDGFEDGTGNWLPSQWTVEALDPHRGSQRIENSPGTYNPHHGHYALTLAGSLDLSDAVSPAWTFYAKGEGAYRHYLKAQISKDGGLTWIDLFSESFSEAEWRQISLDLSDHRESDVRFRILHYSNYSAGGSGFAIDDVGIGEPAPGAPFLHSPEDGATVAVHRPTLTVRNAFDPQTDPLTYHYQVYADEALTDLVAEVPAVAEGEETTSWTVDVDLADSQTYWWRARASDGAESGPFMETAWFRVIIVNDAPSVPEIVAPANGADLWGPDATLTWYRSVDPNPGDTVTYDVTIDNDPAFGSPEIDDTGITDEGTLLAAATPTVTITLGDLDGFENLVAGRRYYWRLRAVDQSGLASAWTDEVRSFDYDVDSIAPTADWSTPDEGATFDDSPILLSGTASDDHSGVDYVQVSTDGGSTWKLANGTTSWSYSFEPEQNGLVTARARAVDRAGQSSAEEVRGFDVQLSDIPRSPRATPDATVISINWRAPALPGSAGFSVYRRAEGESTYTKLNTQPLSVPGFRDTGLLGTDAFYYVVTAHYGGEESGYSEEVFARPLDTGRPPFVDDLRVDRAGDDLELTWSAVTTDPGTGPEACAGYWAYEGPTVPFNPGNASWQEYVSAATSTFFPGGATDGQNHFFLLTAVDDAGHEGFWSQTFVEEDDTAIVRTGTWTDQVADDASGGGLVSSSATDSRLSLTFIGTGFSLSMRRGPDQGIAQILLDGSPVGNVDLYAAEAEWQVWTLHSRGLVDMSHTVEIIVTGDANPASSGTEVNLDRILHGR